VRSINISDTIPYQKQDMSGQARNLEIDGIVEEGILDNLDKIKVYPIRIDSEEALTKEIAGIANEAMALGHKLEDESRLLTKEEAYQQLTRLRGFSLRGKRFNFFSSKISSGGRFYRGLNRL